MKKGSIFIPLILIVIIIGAVGFLSARFFLGGNEDSWICQNGNWVKHGQPNTPQPTGVCAPMTTKTVSSFSSIEEEVPLPSPESTITSFFRLINEKKIPGAIAMMSQLAAVDASAKQAWGVQFNTLSNIVVKKIAPSMPENWTDKQRSYKVIVNLEVSESAKNAPIPYYGWENGENIRWITVEKDERKMWKIVNLSTGP